MGEIIVPRGNLSVMIGEIITIRWDDSGEMVTVKIVGFEPVDENTDRYFTEEIDETDH